MNHRIAILPMKREEIDELIDMIAELADYEKRPFELEKHVLSDRLITYGFGESPLFYVAIARLDNEIAGYIMFSYLISPTKGKPVLYLEDLYVRDKFRRHKIGTEFFDYMSKVAKQKDCCRIQWAVLKWNVLAQNFYDSLKPKNANIEVLYLE